MTEAMPSEGSDPLNRQIIWEKGEQIPALWNIRTEHTYHSIPGDAFPAGANRWL